MFSAGGLGMATNLDSFCTFVQNSLPERWFRIRNLTQELILGHWLGKINRRNSHLNIVEVNQIRQKK